MAAAASNLGGAGMKVPSGRSFFSDGPEVLRTAIFRERLIGEIWDSISIHDTPSPESHREELDRRLAAADADPEAGQSWEEMKTRLRLRF